MLPKWLEQPPPPPPKSTAERRVERKKVAVSVVMLRILEYEAKGFHVMYRDGSSKVSIDGSDKRIGDWGWTDLGNNESFSCIPVNTPQANSVGEFKGAVDVAGSLMHCSDLLLVTDLRYVKDGFVSVHKWKANGWRIA